MIGKITINKNSNPKITYSDKKNVKKEVYWDMKRQILWQKNINIGNKSNSISDYWNRYCEINKVTLIDTEFKPKYNWENIIDYLKKNREKIFFPKINKYARFYEYGDIWILNCDNILKYPQKYCKTTDYFYAKFDFEKKEWLFWTDLFNPNRNTKMHVIEEGEWFSIN